MVAMDFFAALNCYDFLNQYCSNLLKNPTVRGLNEHAQYKRGKGRPENGARKVFSISIERLSMSHLYTPKVGSLLRGWV